MKPSLIVVLLFFCRIGFAQVELKQSYSGDNYFQDFVEFNDYFYGFKINASTTELIKIDSEGEQIVTLTTLDSSEEPESILISDGNIYFTVNINTWQGRLYRFNLSSSTLSTLKDFTSEEGEIVSVKHATDSVLWGFSWRSSEDEGSIFVIKRDGSSFEKIYSVPNSDNGSTPVDITLYNDKVVIAWINGGGIPYQDSFGDSYTSGSFGLYDLKTQMHTTILPGEDLKGTSPYSVLYHDGTIYAAFSEAGNSSYGKLYAIDPETLSSELIFDFPKGDLVRIGFDKLIYSDGYIYGIERFGIFRYSIVDQSAELTFDLLASNFETNSALLISSTGNIFSFITPIFESTPKYLAQFVFPLAVDGQSELNIFPNPVNTSFNLESQAIDLLEIIDLKGTVIKSFKSPELNVDVSDLQIGVYMLRFSIDNRVYIRKLIKR